MKKNMKKKTLKAGLVLNTTKNNKPYQDFEVVVHDLNGVVGVLECGE
jgi:hypothetical protein